MTRLGSFYRKTGNDAKKAIDNLTALIDNKFGEEQ